MGIDLRHVRNAVRLELDPNGPGGALEHVDIILREDGSCATVAYTVPGWHAPKEGQSAEDARTVVTEHRYNRGGTGWAALVVSRTDFEKRNGKITGRWEWQNTPTDAQRAATYREWDRIA
jgi:hypothetical protein